MLQLLFAVFTGAIFTVAVGTTLCCLSMGLVLSPLGASLSVFLAAGLTL